METKKTRTPRPVTLKSFLKHGFKLVVTNEQDNNNIPTEYSLNKPSVEQGWVYLIVWDSENKHITISTHVEKGLDFVVQNNLLNRLNINDFIKPILKSNVETEIQLKSLLNISLPETTNKEK